jgi:hypothetical protein
LVLESDPSLPIHAKILIFFIFTCFQQEDLRLSIRVGKLGGECTTSWTT